MNGFHIDLQERDSHPELIVLRMLHPTHIPTQSASANMNHLHREHPTTTTTISALSLSLLSSSLPSMDLFLSRAYLFDVCKHLMHRSRDHSPLFAVACGITPSTHHLLHPTISTHSQLDYPNTINGKQTPHVGLAYTFQETLPPVSHNSRATKPSRPYDQNRHPRASARDPAQRW